jgi:hypothetical protein
MMIIDTEHYDYYDTAFDDDDAVGTDTLHLLAEVES